ncbi:PH, RCC1 and FYVE domains-containing protein 1-like [Rutidosis leptorrhynchoides]|uniref:PH, RCC1 and FYVE domains-containing protein 1-like n=1 Tax=Rutidosis leptorrhynchoides TaxID=125765 RepID=UPI003A997293
MLFYLTTPPPPPPDRALEQAILALKKGAYILKYGRRGKPKLCPFRLSTDERTLMWLSGNEEKQVQLSSVTSIIRGHPTVSAKKKLQPERECHSFSLIYTKNQVQYSLDLVCKDKAQTDSWFLGLKALISRCRYNVQFERGTQSCVNSPATFARRKYNTELSKESTKISQVRSVCGSPVTSLSDRCFSDGLSFSSDSFYSRSSLSSTHNLTDGLKPNSPDTKPQESKTNRNTITRFGPPAIEPKRPLISDVLIWGEGVETGVLGGGVDQSQTQNDALFPKVLDSVSMLEIEKISLAGKHGVLLSKQGEVFCWGEKSGRFGHNISCPKAVKTLNGVHVTSVSCSEYQTCALTVSGELYTWGDSWLPRRISGVFDGISVINVACGEWHTAIVTNSGHLFTFGDGTFGVLGHGNSQSLTEPKQVDSIKHMRVKSVACGPWHTAAVVVVMSGPPKSSTSAGKLFTWGDGDKGKLGHGNDEIKNKPTCVMQLIDHEFVQVCCGRMLTVGLTTTGAVYTIGSTFHGQLGNPMARENSITLVQGKLKFEFVREIATGSYHVAVLTLNGNIYTWGNGSNGQLGCGDTEDRSSPTLVEALEHRQVQSISCGSNSTAAICLHESIKFGSDYSGCRGCSMEFGFLKKKHNCYNCGLVFCGLCSSNTTKNACLAPDKSKYYRVCDSCYKGLSGQLLKVEDFTPRPLFIKTSLGETGDGNRMVSGAGVDLGSGSLLINRALRWGQVSSPASFRKLPKEESSLKNLYVDSRICVRVNKKDQQNACRETVDPTVKHKRTKDVIKSLTSRLNLMSPRAFMRKQAKAHVDTPTTSANHLTASSTHVSCDVDTGNLNNMCNSIIVPTKHNTSPSDEHVTKSTVYAQNKEKLKHEWTEQYQQGVYITFLLLPSGQKGIKRVRFSRKVFREKEAERWWEANQQEVYDNYNVDGYINSF